MLCLIVGLKGGLVEHVVFIGLREEEIAYRDIRILQIGVLLVGIRGPIGSSCLITGLGGAIS